MPPSSRRTKRRKSLLLLLSSKWRAWHRTLRPACARQTTSEGKPSHFPSGFSVDFSRSLHFRHGFAHLAGVSGADPGRTAGSFSSECPGGGAPARKRWGGTGVLQRQRPPPAAETGSCRWGRGQQDASDSEAAAGCRNPSLFAEKAASTQPAVSGNFIRCYCRSVI